MDVKAYTEVQTYAMVEANDEVIHCMTLCWNTPTPEERSALVMVQIKRLVETEHDDQTPSRLRRERTTYHKHRSTPERGECRATSGVSIRDTSDTPGLSRKRPSNNLEDEKAYKDKVRNDHLKLEESGDGDLLLQSDIGKVFGHRDPPLQIYDGLPDPGDADCPSLGS